MTVTETVSSAPTSEAAEAPAMHASEGGAVAGACRLDDLLAPDDLLVEEELLVEEIPIDGMCGVY